MFIFPAAVCYLKGRIFQMTKCACFFRKHEVVVWLTWGKRLSSGGSSEQKLEHIVKVLWVAELWTVALSVVELLWYEACIKTYGYQSNFCMVTDESIINTV